MSYCYLAFRTNVLLNLCCPGHLSCYSPNETEPLHSLHIYLSLALSSVCLSLSLHVSLSCSLVCLSLPLSASISVLLSHLSVSPSLCVYLSLALSSVCLSLSLHLSLSCSLICLSLILSASISLLLSRCWRALNYNVQVCPPSSTPTDIPGSL